RKPASSDVQGNSKEPPDKKGDDKKPTDVPRSGPLLVKLDDSNPRYVYANDMATIGFRVSGSDYEVPITFELEGLPDGVTCKPARLAARALASGDAFASLKLSAAADVAGEKEVQIVATAGPEKARTAVKLIMQD